MKSPDYASERYHAITRQITGLPYRYHAYVYDRQAGRIVATCSHVHRSRRDAWGRYGGGPQCAQRCADKMLRRWVSAGGNDD